MAKSQISVKLYLAKPKKKRGTHSKKNSTHKHSKNYIKAYVGQGR